ncbi:MAG: hypothetical protein L6Q97_09325 [Thermoanaerobaculia bacterium]|nr:hypothetical protein [Thermoanaerobaculia bacterium]
MSERIPLLATAFICAVAIQLNAQSFQIAWQNPDQLAVCSADTLRIAVRNNTAATLDSVLLELELPAGLTYQTGSVAGALESDTSNPEKPVLRLSGLLPGATANVQLLLYAGCGLIDAINSAQLFTLNIRARSGNLSEQVTTTAFQIQTGLLVITGVENDSVAGEKDDMFVRRFTVQNTRLGAIKHLFLRETVITHFQAQVAGASAEQFDNGLYTAYFNGIRRNCRDRTKDHDYQMSGKSGNGAYRHFRGLELFGNRSSLPGRQRLRRRDRMALDAGTENSLHRHLSPWMGLLRAATLLRHAAIYQRRANGFGRNFGHPDHLSVQR